ncbi:VacJ family lipoprotein [Halarcobacter ebronensis]|uniref:ABC transporter n=1 Tax=Halarcobacter ebronensis TaxID=1462615 RepID=A0A4Q1AKX1_9BACT|nr:VacJ family lipoprotein [Halarcobacter ebronensis]QKF81615.1 lipid asymmetry ABC transporter MlaABCDEF, lipoprotein MlaA [Halarcobacter ebronensis]RXK05541.1 ABC transporter [Halarcobacter ebronensis]
MKKVGLAVLTTFTVALNAATITTHYKVNSNLQFELLPEDQWVTYEVFTKERLFKKVEINSKNEASFDEEYSNNLKDDSFEGYNRAMTSFNDYFYINVLNPVAKGYKEVIPEPGRIAIANFFDNLMFPIRFLNNILQFKFQNALEETGRFVVNSTIGIGGLLDRASENGLKEHKEDFGQTLGYYGFGSGAHIVLPILGPSNVRDIVGLAADMYINPVTDLGKHDIDYKIPDEGWETIAIGTFQTINKTSLNIGQYENLKKDAIDLYPFLRDIYEQNREKAIKE